MPNRIASFAVLLFSFAVVLFSFKPPEGTPIASFNREFDVFVVTLPAIYYYIFAAIAIVTSLSLMLGSFWQRKSRRVEEIVTQRWYSYYPGFVFFWFVYFITWLKGVASILSISPAAWIVYLVFYSGFVLFLLIPAHSVKGWLDRARVSDTERA